ncbi:aldehyde dehydrogenase family protein [Salipiger abyssi]|uniref:aldehyde dehydrogenase family protein n=1 Tax=Salipiger abyssi TaxID=1250539 RepID=UPI001A8D4008|nr:aldehyde dehydrogenase family protein [Salipiger abyssi]MBN9888158.1 aldehyde dehydrogenase family protein [Salipiger abyssi]
MLEALHHIGGEWRPASGWHERRDPATGALVGRFADGGVAELDAAVDAARVAFDTGAWAQSPRLRQTVLLAWADALERDADTLGTLLSQENGKVLGQARNEVVKTASVIRYYAGLARASTGGLVEMAPGEFASMLREPIGVVGIIVPWNAPVSLLARSLAPALAAGCSAVIKPAAQTSLISAAVLKRLTDIPALPAGIVNMIMESGHAAAQRMVAHPDVEMISFTGSTAIGKRIMAAASETLKRVSLELGGKSCCIVFEDADIADIAPRLVGAAIAISGQQCVAARRILVHASRYDEMKAALTAAVGKVVVAGGMEKGAQMGPMIDLAARDTVHARIQEALETSAEVIVPGGVPDDARRDGAFLLPSLVAHDDTGAFFCQEEIFGPFIVLERFETEAEAVAMANHTTFGLSASVWTRDGARGFRIARALRDGVVWLNDHGKLNAEAEAGGYRQSGLGRLYGHEGLHDFQELKQVYQNVGVAGAG